MSATDVPKTSDLVDYRLVEALDVPGSAIEPTSDGKELPLLFRPLKIRGLTLPNRIGVSPMCTYSANDKMEMTDFHLVHYNGFATHGAGVIFIESTAVEKEGGISPHDSGLWTEEQAAKLKKVVDFAHSHKAVIGIQLGHAGRKGSTQPPFIHLEQIVDESVGGWAKSTKGASPIAFRPYGNLLAPIELTTSEVEGLVKSFGNSAKLALKAGVDTIQIHGAHGYLINQFMSSTSNKRTDKYGGSFENRTRLLLEVVDEIRSVVPEDFPLGVRISGSENIVDDPEAWTIEDSQRLAPILVEHGIDIIDVSSGGNSSRQNARGSKVAMHVPLASAIKKAVGDSCIVSTVGALDYSAGEVNKMVEDGQFDVAIIGKAFLKDPGFAWKWADDLGVKINAIQQYKWAFNPRREDIKELINRQMQKEAEHQKQGV